ncbi:allantoicase [Martelella alba]|uniref:Probable allantoicase n=1 Tax=Martelella alba TaxID=2590451 RepID=A0A506UCK1_9HYPH|nr:allantoicase [Martelella alba]TPW31650.1 allantoicase [Martelella alba]
MSEQEMTVSLPDFAIGAINLASARLGARALYATDQFFAPLSRMLKDDAAVFLPGEYDEHGKWMDGWESRRKRVPGHDWAVIKLAMPGRIRGFDVDTSHFTGNFPPQCSIEGCYMEKGDPDDSSDWQEVLSREDLKGNSHHYFEMDQERRQKVFTHLRLHIYPDGGIARLRAYGSAYFNWDKVGDGEEVDLAYIFGGTHALHWSDAHFGHPDRMFAPGRGVNMGDGWETARRRGPGHDWVILKLGHPGIIRRVVVDTAHFKGNFPDSCALFGAYLPDQADVFTAEEIAGSENWQPILEQTKLSADHIHEFGSDQVKTIGPVTHVRVANYPDGGISRLRLYGVKG